MWLYFGKHAKYLIMNFSLWLYGSSSLTLDSTVGKEKGKVYNVKLDRLVSQYIFYGKICIILLNMRKASFHAHFRNTVLKYKIQYILRRQGGACISFSNNL